MKPVETPEGPLTLNEFILWTVFYLPATSIRAIYCFQGAWLASHQFYPDRFPLAQTIGAWCIGYEEWQKVRKEVAA